MAADVGTGIVANVAAKLLEYMGKLAVEKIAPYFGGRSKLNRVKDTMRMIQAGLADAERRGEAENGEAAVIKELLRRLKRVLLRLEDLVEEVDYVTEAADNEQLMMEQMPSSSRGKQLLNYTCVPFSRWSSPLLINKLVADEAKAVMEDLTAIQSDMASLNLISDQSPLVVHHETSHRETYSFVMEEDVIGRDDDKRRILDLILSSDYDVVGENVCVIPIVGIGGLGKTTLAQLVFNDRKVQNHFELKIWACISKISCLKELVEKIIQSIPDEICRQEPLELLQTRLRNIVKDKRYLLVLDDLWDENRQKWLQLKDFLCGGKQGSRIIVTSRSMVVAQNMGTTDPYELGALPEDKSWDLFRRFAFKEGSKERNPNLTSIGKQIVKKCGNLPLAIRTIAGLLYSKDTHQEWEYLKDSELRMIKQDGNIIMSTLKLSYDHLPPHVKQCFAYCSLFPKGHRFDKKYMIELWMAQGFISSLNGNQSLEDVGHIYFMELLRRSFFQEVRTDDYGDMIISCKMHDLVHDLALDVAVGETLFIDGATQQMSDDTLHVNFLYDKPWEVPSSLLAGKKSLRSLIVVKTSYYPLHNLKLDMHEALSNMRHVRALDLRWVSYKSLPNSTGKLKHLRFLRHGDGSVESLVEGITGLRYLQTLDLRGCKKLRQLPNQLNNLNSLRRLGIPRGKLMDLPPGFGQLTSLRDLNEFIVGENNGLDALARLTNLAGCLIIRFRKMHRSVALTRILKETSLTELRLVLKVELPIAGDQEDKEGANLECLQPPPSLKKLTVTNQGGTSFPGWGIDTELRCLLPNLVYVAITCCSRCKKLPPFSRLPRLRSLSLHSLVALEYVEVGGGGASSPYFPSLEYLDLWCLHKLKGWSREEGQSCDEKHRYWPLFPRLLELKIQHCPELMSMPLVPKLVRLVALEIHGKLVKHLLCDEESVSPLTTLKELDIELVSELDSFWVKASSLESLKITDCPDLIDLNLEPPMPLRNLEVRLCGKLTTLSGVLQHLSVLEKLVISGCDELDLGDASSAAAAWQEG